MSVSSIFNEFRSAVDLAIGSLVDSGHHIPVVDESDIETTPFGVVRKTLGDLAASPDAEARQQARLALATLTKMTDAAIQDAAHYVGGALSLIRRSHPQYSERVLSTSANGSKLISFKEAILPVDSPWGQILDGLSAFSFTIRERDKLRNFLIRASLVRQQPPVVDISFHEARALKVILARLDPDQFLSPFFTGLTFLLTGLGYDQQPFALVPKGKNWLGLVNIPGEENSNEWSTLHLFLDSVESLMDGLKFFSKRKKMAPSLLSGLTIYVPCADQSDAKNKIDIVDNVLASHTQLISDIYPDGVYYEVKPLIEPELAPILAFSAGLAGALPLPMPVIR